MEPNLRFLLGWLALTGSLYLSTGCVRSVFNDYNQPPLVQNPGFSHELDEFGLPAGWRAYQDTSELEIIFSGNAVSMRTDTKVRAGLFQHIPVKPGNFYRVDGRFSDSMFNTSEIGLYLEGIQSGKIYAKWKFAKLENQVRPKMIFYNSDNDSLRIFVGGPDGFHGRIILDSVNVKAVRYQQKPFRTELGSFLYKRVQLNFDSVLFDQSIENLSVFLNKVYLDSSFSAELQQLIQLIQPGLGYRYYSNYLQQMDAVNTAYCQRISLSLGEVLENEFGIPVQQVHMNDGQTGIHQFIQYWHPFRQEWVAIDPYYGYVYRQENRRLSAEQVNGKLPGPEMLSYTTVCFDHDAKELAGLWQTTNLEFGGVDLLSYPVGDQAVRVP